MARTYVKPERNQMSSHQTPKPCKGIMTAPPVGHEARLQRLCDYYARCEEILNTKKKRHKGTGVQRQKGTKGRGRHPGYNAANYIKAGEADEILKTVVSD